MIYLDYQATTPLAPEARDAMMRWLDGPDGMGFANPHSPHRPGRQAAAAVDLARERVAALFPPGGKIYFTGSATEALNTVIRGCEPVRAGAGIAVSAIEHAAVWDTARSLSNSFHELAVDTEGLVDPEPAIAEGGGLVAVMQVNNEIGTIQPVAQIAKAAKAAGALFLCDAVQAAGRIPIVHADAIAISAHKLHGPKGIGALWLRDGIDVAPLITGGAQEGGLRSGTLSPALCAGFGAAAKLAQERMQADADHIEALWAKALDLFDGWTVNGSADARWHGNLNVRRDGLDVARLMSDVRNVAFSAGSACASGSGKPSRVLQAIGLSDKHVKNSIRLGFGRYTGLDDLEEAAAAINAAASAQGI